MEVLKVVALLAALCILLSQAALLDDSLRKQTDIYRAQISVIYDEIAKECSSSNSRLKRGSLNDEQLVHFNVHKQLYRTLLKQLVECKKKNANLTSTSTHITTVTTTVTQTITSAVKQTTPNTTRRIPTRTKKTPTSTKRTPTTTRKTPTTTMKIQTPMKNTATPTKRTPTSPKKPAFSPWAFWTIKTRTQSPTTRKPLISPVTPKACQQAKTYKDSWRKDHGGRSIRPGGAYSYGGHKCDFGDRPPKWFRFSGAAGNRMLNKCPPIRSCGTLYPYWTDAKMPSQVGVETTVYVYGSGGVQIGSVLLGNCKVFRRKLKVMRCSTKANDFIYKPYDSLGTCAEAFCGMN